MYKKDYVSISAILSTMPDIMSKLYLIDRLVTMFKEDNPRFKPELFKVASRKVHNGED